MGRGRREWTQAKYERYLREGRGQGRGINYHPWITIQDFPSKGRSSRTPGWKTNRVHHFFSDHEKRYFYLLEWLDFVTDIREQYPLLNLDLAVDIAKEMGIRYPTDSRSGIPHIMTTDFMVTINQNGQTLDIARTIKPSQDLEKKRVLEKLELERRYWSTKQINWAIVTEKEIPRVLADNIDWVHSLYNLESSENLDIKQINALLEILKLKLSERQGTINQITTALDKETNVETGTFLYLFKYLVARKKVIVDMETSKISSCLATQIIQKIIM